MIIGLVGTKRSGKDTVADYLCEKHSFVKYSLADPMKNAVKEIFLMSDEQLWGDKKEEIDPRYNTTPRKILQVFGTELFQYDIYKHIPELSIEPRKLWINRFVQWYNNKQSIEINKFGFQDIFIRPQELRGVVISDVRFPHEADELRKLDAIIIRVVRYPLPKDAHVSETEQINIETDIVIYNTGTIEKLYKNIDKIMREKIDTIYI